MAGYDINIQLGAILDTSNKAISEINRQIRQMQRNPNLKKLKLGFEAATTNRQINEINKKITQIQRHPNFKKLKVSLDVDSKGLDKFSNGLDKTANSAKKTKTAIDKTTKSTISLSDQIRQAAIKFPLWVKFAPNTSNSILQIS